MGWRYGHEDNENECYSIMMVYNEYSKKHIRIAAAMSCTVVTHYECV